MDPQTRSFLSRQTARLASLFHSPGQVVKIADIGGDPEREFEDTFAGLALVYIRDKAPRLLDYLVGFQLIERDDDNKRAVGAFVFRPGNLWLLVYVFFLGGKMRGHEMIHVHSQDQFLPLKERWINTLIAARSPTIGKSVDQNRPNRGWTAPRLTDLTVAPNFGKLSSADGGAFAPFVDSFRSLLTTNPLTDERRRGMTLDSFLEKNGSARVEFRNWTGLYPRLAKYAEDRFGPNWFERMDKQARDTAERAAAALGRVSLLDPVLELKSAADKPKLRIVTELETEAEELSGAEREKFLRTGFIIRDGRSDQETASAWKAELRVGASNPTETGVYDVLTGDKGLERMVVLVHPRTAGNRGHEAVVFDPSDSGRWERTPTNKINARLSPLQTDEWREWWDKLDSVKPVKDDDSYWCLLTRDGDSFGPFSVVSGEDGSWVVGTGLLSDYDEDGGAGDPLRGYNERRRIQRGSSRPQDRCGLIRTEQKGARLCAVGDATYFPKDDCKFVKLKRNRDKPIQLTTVAGVEKLMGVKAANLKVWANDNECMLDGGRAVSRKQALFSLMRDYDLRESDARGVLETATADWRAGRPSSRFWIVKGAAPGVPDSDSMPAPPAMDSTGGDPFGLGMEMLPTQEQNVTALTPDRRSRSPFSPRATTPDNRLMRTVQDAVDSGQQDLVDATAITGLLRTSSVESRVSEYTTGLMKDVDRLCRLLILFYWHGEYFQEQYGKAALPEMEDRLRSAIELVGDTILDLREKLQDRPGQEAILT